jgi:hypothetical protein
MQALAVLAMPGLVVACTRVLVVVCIQAPEVVFTRDLGVVYIPAQGEECTPALVAACIRVPVVDCIQAPVEGYTWDHQAVARGTIADLGGLV